MKRWQLARGGSAAVVAMLGVAMLPGAASASASHAAGLRSVHVTDGMQTPTIWPSSNLTVVASDLNNPRHITFATDSTLYVAEAGSGGSGVCQTDPHSGQPACVGDSGSITRINGPSVTRVLRDLPSVSGLDGTGATGPADVSFVGNGLEIAMQNTQIDQFASNGYGPAGALLGHLVNAQPGSAPSTWHVGADLAKFEVQNNPDNGAGAASSGQSPIDSDPYAVTPYNGGWAVADAAGNDLLWVDPSGNITVLAVFPTKTEELSPGTTGEFQSVPTSVRVGPDGALYVGELAPGLPNRALVYRVLPGQQPTVFASGFTGISDLAFDPWGRLLVLEISVGGLQTVAQQPGALIRVEHNGIHTLLASNGLVAPTGVTVTPTGTIYISNYGVFPSAGPGPHGQVVKLDPLPSPPAYRLAAADGSVFGFGTDQGTALIADAGGAAPVVGIAAKPGGTGYWLARADGTVDSFGGAVSYGSMAGKPLDAPIVGIASTADGNGYWLAAADGGVFNFGDAPFVGSAGGLPLKSPIVGIAATPDGGGFWLVASDGGVFSYGTATFFGSTGGIVLNRPIVGIAGTADGAGYWLVASDGGVFGFGDGAFLGSAGNVALTQPIVAIVASADGGGYNIVDADGEVFSYGTAFAGSKAGEALPAPIVAASG